MGLALGLGQNLVPTFDTLKETWEGWRGRGMGLALGLVRNLVPIFDTLNETTMMEGVIKHTK